MLTKKAARFRSVRMRAALALCTSVLNVSFCLEKVGAEKPHSSSSSLTRSSSPETMVRPKAPQPAQGSKRLVMGDSRAQSGQRPSAGMISMVSRAPSQKRPLAARLETELDAVRHHPRELPDLQDHIGHPAPTRMPLANLHHALGYRHLVHRAPPHSGIKVAMIPESGPEQKGKLSRLRRG